MSSVAANIPRLVMQSLSEPRAAMRRVLALNLSIQEIVQALGIVVILTVLLEQLLIWMMTEGNFLGVENNPFIVLGEALPPLLHVANQVIQTALSWFVLHAVAKRFGGTGTPEQSGMAIMWMGFMLLVFLAAMILASVVFPVLAVLVVFAVAFYMVYMGINFAKEVHGFTNGGMVFVGLVVSYLMVIFASAFLVGFLGLAPNVEGVGNV